MTFCSRHENRQQQHKPKTNKKDKGKAWRLNHANLVEGTGAQDVFFLPDSSDSFPCLDSDDMAWLEYSRLGTSEKQQQLMTDQKEELKRAIQRLTAVNKKQRMNLRESRNRN